MNTISIKTGEEIHHTCLMYGLNRAYARYPFLARNPLATPPPFRRSPERPALFIGCGMSPVCVQYYKTDMRVLYKKNKVTADEAAAFAKAIMEEYLALRHPFMKRKWEGGILMEETTGHTIAEVG
ncbi:MAG: hypothetical protein IJF06_04765 [Bacteroidaceae bacterium]|nr:hypothetical protein [Bacteroidaceae bacterium]